MIFDRRPVKRIDALVAGDLFFVGDALHEVQHLAASPDPYALSIVTANGRTLVMKRYESVKVQP